MRLRAAREPGAGFMRINMRRTVRSTSTGNGRYVTHRYITGIERVHAGRWMKKYPRFCNAIKGSVYSRGTVPDPAEGWETARNDPIRKVRTREKAAKSRGKGRVFRRIKPLKICNTTHSTLLGLLGSI